MTISDPIIDHTSRRRAPEWVVYVRGTSTVNVERFDTEEQAWRFARKARGDAPKPAAKTRFARVLELLGRVSHTTTSYL